jgi:hypothetical protein
MRKTLYCLLPDSSRCPRLMDRLLEAGMSRRHICMVNRGRKEFAGIRRATLLQTTDVGHGVILGAGMGGLAGALGGYFAAAHAPVSALTETNGTWLYLAAAGAAFGAIVTGVITRNMPNRNLVPFLMRIGSRGCLLILDIPTHRIPMAVELIERVDPMARTYLA